MHRSLIILFWCGFLLFGCLAEPDVTAVPSPSPPPPTASPVVGVDFVTRTAPTAQIVQVTATPLPTATTAPTPTPIIYAVVEGDTLLGIALAHGTTVEMLESLNPGVSSGFLQIGQGLILPPPPTPPPFSAGETIAPLTVEVVNVRQLPVSGGGLIVMGEVENEGTEPVENVQINLALQTADGETVVTSQTWIAEPIILPGEKGPFVLRFTQLAADNLLPQVAVIGGQTVVDLGSRTLDLIVLDGFDVVIEGEYVLIEGEIMNVGETAVSELLLVASFYDDQDRLTGYQQLQMSPALSSGAAVPFTLQAVPPGGGSRSVEIAVFGLKGED